MKPRWELESECLKELMKYLKFIKRYRDEELKKANENTINAFEELLVQNDETLTKAYGQHRTIPPMNHQRTGINTILSIAHQALRASADEQLAHIEQQQAQIIVKVLRFLREY